MTLAWGDYDSNKYLVPLFPLYPTEVTFAKSLVNIEILGTSECGGNELYSGNLTNGTYAVVVNEYDVSSVVI